MKAILIAWILTIGGLQDTLVAQQQPFRSILIVDAETGKPIPEFDVYFMDTARALTREQTQTEPLLLARNWNLLDLGDFFKKHGQLLRSDQNGRVLVPHFKSKAILFAHTSAKWGHLELNQSAKDWPPLRLVPDKFAKVRVVGAEGQSRGGVSVRFHLHLDGFPVSPVMRRVTDGEGIATFRGWEVRPGEWRISAQLAIPGMDLESTPLSLGLDRPTTIKVPPTGSLKLLLKNAEGQPFLGDAWVFLTSPERAPITFPREDIQSKKATEWLLDSIPAIRGVAFFPDVAPDVNMAAVIWSLSAKFRTQGVLLRTPRALKTMTHTAVCGKPCPTISAALTDDKQRPIANLRIEVSVEAAYSIPGQKPDYRGRPLVQTRTTTDGRGKFRIFLDIPVSAVSDYKLRVTLRELDSHGKPVMSPIAQAVLSEPLREGNTALGALTAKRISQGRRHKNP